LKVIADKYETGTTAYDRRARINLQHQPDPFVFFPLIHHQPSITRNTTLITPPLHHTAS
jgi:hypothetical protein